jgi:hypothetical protein
MQELQQWDYKVLRTYGGVVMMVDGQEIAEMEAGQPIGEMLYEYLDGLGRDGWEVVGMAGVREGAEIILKRPLMEEELEEEEED